MKNIYLLSCLLAFSLVAPMAGYAQLKLSVSAATSDTYSVGQSLTVTITDANPDLTYSLDAFASSTATTPMTAVTITHAQGASNTFTGQTQAVFLVRFLPGSEGAGRVLKLVDTGDNDRTESGELTIVPAPTLMLIPSLATYTEGQSVTVVMTGGLPNQDYIIKLYSSLPPGITNDLSGEITPSTNQTSVNTITWAAGQTTAEFYVRLDKQSLGADRYLLVTNLNFSHLGASQPFKICPGNGAQASDIAVLGTLGPDNCSVRVQTQATGNSFVFTGPNGYVFSNVYREAGTYTVFAPITQPGTYTLTSTYSNSYCGTSIVTKTFEVTGTACK